MHPGEKLLLEEVSQFVRVSENNNSELNKYLHPKYKSKRVTQRFSLRTKKLLHNLKRSLEITKLRYCRREPVSQFIAI